MANVSSFAASFPAAAALPYLSDFFGENHSLQNPDGYGDACFWTLIERKEKKILLFSCFLSSSICFLEKGRHKVRHSTIVAKTRSRRREANDLSDAFCSSNSISVFTSDQRLLLLHPCRR
jgi:hypothetical protein